MSRTLTVGKFIEANGESLSLEDLGAGIGLDTGIPNADISSPGLALAGYVDRFVAERLQVLGETEIKYLTSLDSADRSRILNSFFAFSMPAVRIRIRLKACAKQQREREFRCFALASRPRNSTGA